MQDIQVPGFFIKQYRLSLAMEVESPEFMYRYCLPLRHLANYMIFHIADFNIYRELCINVPLQWLMVITQGSHKEVGELKDFTIGCATHLSA